MGTDIHGGFIKVETNSEGKVVNKQPIKTSWFGDRDYTLFAILAGVRNGFGFAGCYRHEPLIPIAEGRGLPSFIEKDEEYYSTDFYNRWYGKYDNEPEMGVYLGDHSFTYMTIDEILDWKGWDNHLQQGGVLSLEHYKETLAVGKEPESWCGGISGSDVLVVKQDDLGKDDIVPTHIQCRWKSEQTLGEMYDWFLSEVKTLKQEYGSDVVLVVGFDS